MEITTKSQCFSQKRAIKKQMSIMALQIDFWTEEIDRSFKVWA